MEFLQFVGMMMVLLSFISWFLGPYVAYTNGRSAWKAFFLCFFLGWIGLVIVFLLEKKKPCKACGAKIPDRAFLCTYCDYDVRTLAPTDRK